MHRNLPIPPSCTLDHPAHQLTSRSPPPVRPTQLVLHSAEPAQGNTRRRNVVSLNDNAPRGSAGEPGRRKTPQTQRPCRGHALSAKVGKKTDLPPLLLNNDLNSAFTPAGSSLVHLIFPAVVNKLVQALGLKLFCCKGPWKKMWRQNLVTKVGSFPSK